MTDQQHAESAAILNAASGLVAISNYDCTLMRRLYPAPKWRTHVSTERTIHSTKDKRVEVLWTNFDLGTTAPPRAKGSLFDDAHGAPRTTPDRPDTDPQPSSTSPSPPPTKAQVAIREKP